MLQRIIEQQYGISADEELQVGDYKAVKKNNELYFIVPSSLSQEELAELDQIARHLISAGDRYVSALVKTKTGQFVYESGGTAHCLLFYRQRETDRQINIGRKLAKFHVRGRSLPFSVEKISRIGQWKQLWETRLEQMETVWNGKLIHQPDHEFDKLFLDSFPYYMGLTENAIQYLVDTEIDEQPTGADGGTVCHERFSETTWRKPLIKNPLDWTFDHPSRDLAEWTRNHYFHHTQTYQPGLKQFLQNYQTISRLSPFAWRLLYARILFPLHYFDCVENYYTSSSEQQKHLLEDRFNKYLSQSGEYERFLGDFYQLAEVPVRRLSIPEPEWLKIH
ncbi:spore coat protein YutH [Bacillus canaveralius]|uniref:Spore coat protein YutH n=1 Tax=Bacillus canaveralius TaxID=1403243 RepID=A0A2N5GLZ3_9BACI|nr:spore coat protein YutH [Bacillus canaveralius]PLR82851.1 spore coat protein YutH [Bacillus canaveralius]PLR97144.1 spore coat protein YutH [Bacillus canaveralius]